MKLIPLCIILLFSSNLFAQFAVVTNKDGYLNVRNEEKKGSKISDTLKNDFIVYAFQSDSSWVAIDYNKQNKYLHGYIDKDKIKYLSEFTKIPSIIQSPTKVIFHKDSLKIFLENKKFDPKTSKITYSKDNKSIVEKINEKKIWGTNGNMPKIAYKSIKIFKGSKYNPLLKDVYDDLFEPNFPYAQIYYNEIADIIYISCSNGEGAGSCEVVWVIEKGKYKERKIAYNF